MSTNVRQRRNDETSEEQRERVAREAQMKKEAAEANEAAVDRMIRRNIEQFGP